ncbi:MAG: hypothetical protein IIW77_01145 [Bacteroidaceae bacterium]|jgi:hypothetical protein|nr:hypothetical protein [Bacteroidaceae bacterium]
METEDEDIKRIGYTSAQEFIDIMEEKRKKKELEIKNKVLIHLGLVDKEKSYREYLPYWQNNDCKWDEGACKYYIERNVPLEVTDEEYMKIVEYAEEEIEEEKPKKGTKWGTAIEVIAWIGMICIIISSIISFVNNGFRWAELVWIISIVPSFCLLVGFSKIVSAAEKYLRN